MKPLRTAFLRVLRAPFDDRGDRGSAMLIAMLVIVILTLIGLSFAFFSDTENRIAQNERDDFQVLYVAEAGVNLVQSWFNQPNPAKNAMVPAKTQVDLTKRRGDSDWNDLDDIDVPGGSPNPDTNTNKNIKYEGGMRSGLRRLFDQEFRPSTKETFWGHRDNPEVYIDLTTDGGSYLAEVNKLFNTPKDKSLGVPRIQEIRVYSPPLARDISYRLGVATIEVTAVKVIQNPDGTEREVSRRVVRDVLQEYPFPGPRGAIESKGTIKWNGNFQPHWGLVESEDVMDIKLGKWRASFPRMNPDDLYPNSKFFNYRDFSPRQKPDYYGTPKTSLIRELVGKTRNSQGGTVAHPNVEDPWLEARTAKYIMGAPNTTSKQPWPHDVDNWITNAGLIQASSNSAPWERSNLLQNVSVLFPVMYYDIWKAVAVTGGKNINYFTYAGIGPGNEAYFQLRGGGAKKVFFDWVNTNLANVKPGFFFFDTKDANNPQKWINPAWQGQVTEKVKLAGGGNQPLLMQGFIFLNSTAVDSSGLGQGTEVWINMPGEPFNDYGIDLDGDGKVPYCGELDQPGLCEVDSSLPSDEAATFQNELWDVVFDTSTGPPFASDGENFFALYKEDGTKESKFSNFESGHRFADNCVPHDADCAVAPDQATFNPHAWQPALQPAAFPIHEEFLNLDYPPVPAGGVTTLRVDWDIDDSANTNAEPIDVGTADIRTSATANPRTVAKRYTTAACDRDGGLYKLKLHLYGVFYNEGRYEGTGNFVGYGSLLMREGFQGNGTIDMYYDQSLMKNRWPPESFNLPRVFVSARETE